jgi:glycosyltransferase involved in cell wall biosynthesis
MVSYIFPPCGGAGVQRILKFVKYLPNYGWEPVVLTVKKHFYFPYDLSLLNEVSSNTLVYKTSAFEFGNFPRPFPKNQSNDSHPDKRVNLEPPRMVKQLKDFLKLFITTWFCIPDTKIWWLPFAIVKGLSIIRNEKIEAIFSTASPFSVHLIGYALSMISHKPWIADFRDPWTQNVSRSWPNKVRKKIEEFMEYKVLQRADKIISVSEPIKNNLMNKYPRIEKSKFITITNGFDPQDFRDFKRDKSSKFTITYGGSFYGKMTPIYFLAALRKIVDEDPGIEENIKCNLVGVSFEEDLDKLVKNLRLEKIVCIVGYLPYREYLRYLMNSDVLLLIIGSGTGSEGIFTEKIFNYIATGNPILALVPHGVAADMLKLCGNAIIVPPDDIDAITTGISSLFLKYTEGKLTKFEEVSLFEKYQRKELTKKLARILSEYL